ncbi:FMN-binding protein [Desulfonema ishimotonii]|uniref:Ion-translocating oxidoreductase complex subunit G n=1 Tax=Desulfonema ishimotonii TaxID=45657 RepID=A0A401FY18_9BACT|nr:FMN-binding protein [Desulfonema ishimotonii]GBC61849.1 FMN-binding protein [Desulfonema ishimotonii]
MKPIQPMEPMSLSTFERLRNNNIIQAWLVLILTLIFGSSLAGIQMTLGPRIEENKINETREKVPELVLGQEAAQKLAESGQALEITPLSVVVDKGVKKVSYSVFEAIGPDKKRAGWVVKTRGQGYADRIELLLGLSPDAKKVTGLFILDQKETPGLGNKIVTPEWRGQFIGKATAGSLSVVKGSATAPDQINAITGATISSDSVTGIINAAIADLRGPLAAKASGGE